MPALSVQETPVSQLNPATYNPRTISPEDMASLERSIAAFGFVENIVANKDGTVISGHQRLAAAKKLGLATVPVYFVDLPKDKEKALNIAMNRISGEFDMTKLPELIASLPGEMQELTGFSSSEISEMLDAVQLGEVEEDETPAAPVEPKAKLGDLYQLGEHRLLCGDATNVQHVERLMGGEKADMVFTDPPYNAAFNGRSGKFEVIKNDELPKAEFEAFIGGFMSVLATLQAPEVYVCCDWRFMPLLMRLAEFRNCIVWAKNSFSMGRGYRRQHEFILYTGVFDSTTESDLWKISKDTNYQHPTQKPVELPARAIKNSSAQGNIVVDLFGGSGSTLMACEHFHRKCRVLELDPKYVDVIILRYCQFTKTDPDLVYSTVLR